MATILPRLPQDTTVIRVIQELKTEIGTDGWISSLMEAPMQAAGHNPAWVLVYTSAIMMVLRMRGIGWCA